MNIKFVTPTTIIFNNMNGVLVYGDENIFLQQICKIDTTKYDYIYKLEDGWASSYLFIKDKTYRYIKCGAGIPIVNDVTGELSSIS